MRPRGLGLALGLAALCPQGVAAEEAVDCLIEPKVTVSLSTPVEGVIEEVLVERGDFVERDQVLVRLESDVERAALSLAQSRVDASARLEQSRVNLEYAERTLAYVHQLWGREVMLETRLENAPCRLKVNDEGFAVKQGEA